MAKLNGTDLDPNLGTDFPSYFQMSSALVPICLPPDNMLGLPLPGTTCGFEFVQNGYYMGLGALAPGTYTLEFGEGDPTSGFGAIDTITVAPEPASSMLLAAGLVGFVLMRRRKTA